MRKLLPSGERLAMELSIAAQPLSYPVIPQTGGCRKARWGRGTHGKSGGIRAAFYYYIRGETVYLIDAYAKNRKENLQMPKRMPSKSSPKLSKTLAGNLSPKAPAAKSTPLGSTLIEGMTQILAHVRGEIQLKSYTLPGPLDIKAIRKKVGMSQSEFAAAFALNRRTLQEWEQGKTSPDNAVRAYLTVIDRNPRAVVQALRS